MLQLLFCYSKDIKIEGNKRIEEDTIKSYFSDEALQNSEVLNNTIKNLYSKGYFKEISTKTVGNTLIVTVKEQPLVRKVAFEGLKKLKEVDVRKNLKIKENETFSEAKIEETEIILSEMYRANGYYATKITSKKVDLPDNRLDVVFEVNEGPKAYINSINFVGNKYVSDSELSKAIQSKTYSSFRFFSNVHYFSKERFITDSESIVEYYKNTGFPDARVETIISDLAQNKSGFNLTFFVTEGDAYKFGKVSIDSQIKELNTHKLRHNIGPKTGRFFDQSKINDSVESLIHAAGKQGVNFVDVQYDLKKNEKDKTIDVVFNIRRGKRIKIGKINIKGNKFNRDETIRSNLLVHDGDPYNPYLIEKSEKGLKYTGFFKKVELNQKEVSDDVVDLEVQVEEQPTGSLAFQVGFGTIEGPLGQIKFSKPNLGGTTKEIDGTLSVGRYEQELSFNISDSRFLERNLTAGFGVTMGRNAFHSSSTSRYIGGSVFASYPLSDYLAQSFKYGAGLSNIKRSSRSGFNDDEGINIPNLPTAKERADSEMIEADKQFIKDYNLNKDDWHFTRKETKDLTNKVKNLTDAEFNNIKSILEAKKVKIEKREDLLLFLYHQDQSYRQDYLLQDDVGTKLYSQLTHSISVAPPFKGLYNKHRLNFTMDNTVSGLGGSVYYFRNVFGTSYRYNVTTKIRFLAKVSYGMISRIGGKAIRRSDCETLGAYTLHGFAFDGVSPVDKLTGLPVGGTRFYNGGLELSFPLFFPEEYNVRGGVYTEFGAAYKSKFKNAKIYTDPSLGYKSTYEKDFYDESALRQSVGGYVQIGLPGFPLRFDYAIPVRKKDYDRTQRFLLGVAGIF